MEKMEHIILEDQKGDRIDKVISGLDEEWSRTQVQQWIKEGNITVNGQQIKTNYKCNVDDRIEITIPDPEELDVVPEDLNLEIYYEDSDKSDRSHVVR